MSEVDQHVHEHELILATATDNIFWCYKCGKVEHLKVFANGASLRLSFEVDSKDPIQKDFYENKSSNLSDDWFDPEDK